LLRTRKNIRIIFLLAILALTPGVLTLLYSQTFIYVGMGATNWQWRSGLSVPINVSLSVSNSTPVLTETINVERLTIFQFNITGGNVTIVVSCETNGTIATYSSLTDEQVVYLTYPTVEPTGNYKQDFNVTVFWIDSNATVSFFYYSTQAMHYDESVTYILRGYEEIRALGDYLLTGGLVMTGILVLLGLIAFGLTRQRIDNPYPPSFVV